MRLMVFGYSMILATLAAIASAFLAPPLNFYVGLAAVGLAMLGTILAIMETK